MFHTIFSRQNNTVWNSVFVRWLLEHWVQAQVVFDRAKHGFTRTRHRFLFASVEAHSKARHKRGQGRIQISTQLEQHGGLVGFPDKLRSQLRLD